MRPSEINTISFKTLDPGEGQVSIEAYVGKVENDLKKIYHKILCSRYG